MLKWIRWGGTETSLTLTLSAQFSNSLDSTLVQKSIGACVIGHRIRSAGVWGDQADFSRCSLDTLLRHKKPKMAGRSVILKETKD